MRAPERAGNGSLKPSRDAVSLRIIVRDMVSGRFGTLDVSLKTLPVR